MHRLALILITFDVFFIDFIKPSHKTNLRKIYMSKLLDPNQVYRYETMFDTSFQKSNSQDTIGYSFI